MENLLDQTKKFYCFGPDEKFWLFKYEYNTDYTGWQAYSKRPGLAIIVPEGQWTEETVYRFMNIYTRKLTDNDKIDLFMFLYHGGLENFLAKNKGKK